MSLLGKDALRSQMLKRETVAVPAWGGDVIIRELSGREQAELTAMRKTMADGDLAAGMRIMANVIGCAWINDDGSHVLTTSEEIDALLDQSVDVLRLLSDAAMRLSGEKEGAATEAKKNSISTLNDGSGSGSPASSAAAQ